MKRKWRVSVSLRPPRSSQVLVEMDWEGEWFCVGCCWGYEIAFVGPVWWLALSKEKYFV